MQTFPDGTLGQTSKLDSIPDISPPRPPKPHPAHDRSPVETCSLSRTASDTDSSYCVPTAGMPLSRSNTISTVELNKLRKDASSQDCYDIPRTFPSDRSSSLEGFHNHFKIKNVLTVGSVSSEEMDENYVPMNPNSPPRQHSSSFTEPIQEANYVPMTPGTFDFSAFGMQVPPPAHMGFRSSPKTPPRRPVPVADCEPPPVDRNLKPDRKVKPAPLEIKPLPEWEELQAPVRSPITRSFARDSSRFPLSPRPDSVHSTTSSSDSHDSEENYVPMNPNLSSEDQSLLGSNSLDGGSSPVIKPKGDKQVEYLDLDLDSGKSTPPCKQKSSGSGSSVADERVDYVVVDQQKTLALKSTREAWTDGRQSTESETPSKNVK
ncbi:GRB2-associated-binding protein 1-like [Lepus europaeus]|uniref:GRB2-associated-binding protein 1-like n=1 Tax=Lepus europaeus TaxID=9983 RepID=UPI002B49003C|nr:GRB2-associated-binding protein 1-like [Lepus europaeus]